MALLAASSPPSVGVPGAPPRLPSSYRGSFMTSRNHNPNPNRRVWKRGARIEAAAPRTCELEPLTLDGGGISVREAASEEELLAAVRLRVRTFYDFNPASFGIEDHKRYLAEREFEALKDRLSGKRIGFRRVSCINATLPSSRFLSSSEDLCSACKGGGADVLRAYLSNVCVAKELQRNGLGQALIAMSKKVTRRWGIADLYVHVAEDNEAAQKLYQKSGFVYENEEPAWQARFLGRPRRLLIWANLTQTHL